MLETYIRPVKINGNTSNQWDVASAYEALRALSQNEAGIASVIQNSFSRDMRLKLEATSRHVRTLNMVELGDHS